MLLKSRLVVYVLVVEVHLTESAQTQSEPPKEAYGVVLVFVTPSDVDPLGNRP